jgi:hypothetical protein
MVESIYDTIQTSFELIVLDQGSTYVPFLKYLKSLHLNYPNVTVIEREPTDHLHFAIVQKRRGPPLPAIHMVNRVAYRVQEYLRKHPHIQYYVVSDGDLSLRGCKGDILLFLVSLMKACPRFKQVGAHLRIDNLPDYYKLKKEVQILRVLEAFS